MNNNLVILAVTLLIALAQSNYVSAYSLPITESGLNSAKIRNQERELQNLKNQVYQKSYADPATSTAKLIMEMSLQNAADEKLKKEIEKDMSAKLKKSQAINCGDLMGDHSEYSKDLKKCECTDEYREYKNKCIDKAEYGLEYCKESLGLNSKYDSNKDTCVTNEAYCKEVMGDNSRYLISEGRCECDEGFILNEGLCVKEQSADNSEIQPDGKFASWHVSEKIVSFFQKFKLW